MGSNMAEQHPVGFQWVMEAKERGAKVIHVDPRFTRTSAMADLHVPIRAGSDIAFLGGVIRYILENDREFREYVTHFTNASVILKDDLETAPTQLSLLVTTDGSVHDVKVTRPSGIPEYDENVRRAVVRAAPFGPLPPELHASSAHWSISFDARNPAIR